MSDLTLIFGNKNYSSWSLRPWIFMKHFKIPFEEKRVPLFTETTDEQLAAYFSDFKVPVLQDGDDFVVWDSLAILEYLSENYLEGKGWPADARARAVARSISAEMHSSFPNVRNEMPMNCRKTFNNIDFSAAAVREVERIKQLWNRCKTGYGKNGDWLFGEYSIADAMYAPVVLRFRGYGISLSALERDYVSTTLKEPNLQAWIEAAKAETEVIEFDEI